jgi:hypothetical protein
MVENIDNEFAHFCGKCQKIIPIGVKYTILYKEETLPCGKTRTREIPVHIECKENNG